MTDELVKKARRKFREDSWTDEAVAAQKAALSAETPPEGYVKLADVSKACRLAGIPVSKLVRATGGDRGMNPPADPLFQVTFVGRTRYLHPDVLTKGMELLKTSGFATKPRVKKAKAEGDGESGAVKSAKKARSTVKAEPPKGAPVSRTEVWEAPK